MVSVDRMDHVDGSGTMKLGQIESVAQELVNATSPLVGGRTINIMDTAGTIIASSDSTRIGSFHPGAAEVLEQKEPVRIYAQDLGRYPGAKEGINLPIQQRGKLLGVVGILGNPDEVADAANLLGVYVGLYLEQATAARHSALRREMRLALLRQLVSGTGEESGLFETAHELSLELRLPARVICVNQDLPDRLRRLKLLSRIEESLAGEGLYDPNRDVCGILDGKLVIVKAMPAIFSMHSYLERLYEVAATEPDCEPQIGAGWEASSWTALANSYEEACMLCLLRGPGCHDLGDGESRARYLMSKVDMRSMKRLIEPLWKTVCDEFGESDWVATVDAYCSAGFSVGHASERLHIHKNTLLYRIKKILSLMGLEEESSFVRDYFLNMLLICQRRMHQSEQTNT